MDERKRFWAEHIEAFRASGQPQRVYCARHGLAPRSLRSWRTRLHGPIRPVPKKDDAWMGGAGHGASNGACPVAEAAAPAVDVPKAATEVLGGPLVRRQWSDDEKRRLVYEGLRSGVGLGKFARMCGLQPSMLFRWRNTYALLVDLPAPSDVARDQPAFADVRIAPAPQPARTAALPATPATENRAASDAIEIVLGGGRRVRVGPGVDADALRRVLAVLEGSA